MRKLLDRYVVTEAEKGTIGEVLPSLDRFAASFAKWRWQTLGKVCGDLLRVMPALLLLNSFYDDLKSVFPCKEADLWNAFVYCISTPAFWQKTKALGLIAAWLAFIFFSKHKYFPKQYLR